MRHARGPFIEHTGTCRFCTLLIWIESSEQVLQFGRYQEFQVLEQDDYVVEKYFVKQHFILQWNRICVCFCYSSTKNICRYASVETWDMVIAVRLARYLELGLFARCFLCTSPFEHVTIQEKHFLNPWTRSDASFMAQKGKVHQTRRNEVNRKWLVQRRAIFNALKLFLLMLQI